MLLIYLHVQQSGASAGEESNGNCVIGDILATLFIEYCSIDVLSMTLEHGFGTRLVTCHYYNWLALGRYGGWSAILLLDRPPIV